MGVYHLSGLGLSPGSVTVPLTYVYLLLKAAYKNNVEAAKEFFIISGERGNKREKYKGAPEALVIFTSKEVIEGELKGSANSNWFGMGKITNQDVPIIIFRYLNKLFQEFKKEGLSDMVRKLKSIYLVEVNHQDYYDCYYKISVTMNALEGKEVWVNMVGGTNQINAALLIAGEMYSVPSVYYYLFQNNITLLHPDILEKYPRDMTPGLTDELLKNWNELPLLTVSMNLIETLKNLFDKQEKISISQLDQVVKAYDIRPIKLGRLYIINEEKRYVMPSNFFKRLVSMKEKVDQENVNNLSEWKAWGKDKEILKEVSVIDGQIDYASLKAR